MRDGDDVAGRGGVAQVPLGGRGGGGSQVGEEGEAAGAAGGGRALEEGGRRERRGRRGRGGERSVQGAGLTAEWRDDVKKRGRGWLKRE